MAASVSSDAGGLIDGRAGRLLDDLLMTPLHGAVALADVDAVAVVVDEHLDLDVARLLEPLLEVQRVVAEGGAGFGATHRQGLLELTRRAHHAHALATAARGRLDEQRITDAFGLLECMLRRRAACPAEPGTMGRPCAASNSRVPAFEAKRSRTSAEGPMKVRSWARVISAKASSSERKP